MGKLVHLVKNLLKMTEEAVVLKKEECEFYIGVIPLKGRTKIFYGWNFEIKSGESGKYTFTIGKVCMMNGKKRNQLITRNVTP